MFQKKMKPLAFILLSKIALLLKPVSVIIMFRISIIFREVPSIGYFLVFVLILRLADALNYPSLTVADVKLTGVRDSILESADFKRYFKINACRLSN